MKVAFYYDFIIIIRHFDLSANMEFLCPNGQLVSILSWSLKSDVKGKARLYAAKLFSSLIMLSDIINLIFCATPKLRKSFLNISLDSGI